MPPVYRVRGVGETDTFTTITEYFRLYTLDVASNAEEGTVAQSTLRADDPSGAFDVVGHRQFRVTEDSATSSNTTIYAGYTAARRVSRGDYRTTTARVWDIDLVDLNSVLARRVMTGSDCNRPAETDVARLQWLLTTGEAVLIQDSLYLNTTGAVTMDAVDYRGQRMSDIIDDCAQASGKNYFVWFREETGNFSLWYDFDSSTSYSSPLRLTNVLSDVDETWTFAISPDTQLSRSPDRVNSGAYLPYDGGAVYVQSFVTANAFARRDAVMPAENVKSQAKAQARATRYLGTMNSEEDVITTTVTLPAAKVNFLMQGMRVQIRATHLPGYESYVWARLLNRSVLQVSEDYYEVKCELSTESPGSPGPLSFSVTADEINGGSTAGANGTISPSDLAVGDIWQCEFTYTNHPTQGSYGQQMGFYDGPVTSGWLGNISYLPGAEWDGNLGNAGSQLLAPYSEAAGATLTASLTLTVTEFMMSQFTATQYFGLTGAHSPTTPVVPGETATLVMTMTGGPRFIG